MNEPTQARLDAVIAAYEDYKVAGRLDSWTLETKFAAQIVEVLRDARARIAELEGALGRAEQLCLIAAEQVSPGLLRDNLSTVRGYRWKRWTPAHRITALSAELQAWQEGLARVTGNAKQLSQVIAFVEGKAAEVERLQDIIKNKAAEKAPHSFAIFKWACGHEGGAACVVCFEARCAEIHPEDRHPDLGEPQWAPREPEEAR